MAVRDLYMTATGMTHLAEITVRESLSSPTVVAEIRCGAHTVAIGDVIAAVDIGWATDHAVLITNGIVKSIRYSRPDHLYTILVHDALIRAVDYFMVADDPNSPFQAYNISGENLIRDLLAQAGLTAFTGVATGFTFATVEPKAINLISVWDAINNIAKICGCVLYMDSAGTVQLSTRKPYPGGGDVSAFSVVGGSGQNLEDIDYSISDEGIRNRIVVYGTSGVFASASAVSPYLPAGFYKSLPIAHELIDSNAQAAATAALNLTIFNRRTDNCDVTVLGKPSVRARTIMDITDTRSGLSADLFVVSGTVHTVGPKGYSMALTGTR